MCLAVPAKIVSLDENGQGEVDYLGTRVKVSFLLLEEAKLGDWVIVHAGYAISRMDEQEARETLSLLRELASAQDR